MLLCAACRELGAVCCVLAAPLPRSLLLTAQHSPPAYASPVPAPPVLPLCCPPLPSPALPCPVLPAACTRCMTRRRALRWSWLGSARRVDASSSACRSSWWRRRVSGSGSGSGCGRVVVVVVAVAALMAAEQDWAGRGTGRQAACAHAALPCPACVPNVGSLTSPFCPPLPACPLPPLQSPWPRRRWKPRTWMTE